MPLVLVMGDAVVEPPAMIKKISLLTKVEHGERRGVEDVYALKPIHVLSAVHMAWSRDEAALPAFFLVVTRVAAPVSRARE